MGKYVHVLSAPAVPAGPAGPRRLPPLLRRAWYGLNQAFRRRIAHLDITPDQFSILRWLEEGDARGLTQREITDLMAADPNTVAAIVGRMERAGLIARAVHESDRRAHRVRLKAAGRRKLEAGRGIALALQSEVLAGVPESGREQFLAQLEVLAEACQTAAEAGGRSERTPPAGP